MSLLDRQIERARRDVARLIRLSRVEARLLRPQEEGDDSFFGAHESGEVEIVRIPIEMKSLSATDLAELGADAVASALPDSGVQEQDFLEVEGERYRVSDIRKHNLFGVVTHLELHLEHEKREVQHG